MLYRQTILLSSFASAEMNALLGRCCRNHAGRVRLVPAHRGVLGEVVPQARQVFERLPVAARAGGASTDADARFEHFKRVLWPRLRESGRSGGHLVYIPSYFDYVRCAGLGVEMARWVCHVCVRGDGRQGRAAPPWTAKACGAAWQGPAISRVLGARSHGFMASA